MRLLLDERVPRPLKRDLAGHDVWHVVEMGWSSRRNGELLRLMITERFSAFLTVDQNIEFQQNLRASGVGVVVAIARTNRIKELRPSVPKILEALERLKPGRTRQSMTFASNGEPRVSLVVARRNTSTSDESQQRGPGQT